MSDEKLREIFAEYGIDLPQLCIDTIMQISRLPTSDIVKLFNDIVIEDVFSPSNKVRLF